MAAPVRNLVLDTEAAHALLARESRNRKRAVVLEAIMAANGACVVPTAVRCEAGWCRSDPPSADANRLVPADHHLDWPGADRSVTLRRAVSSASVVDAAVAVAAEASSDADVVEVLTSDAEDLSALTGHLDRRVAVHTL